MLPRRIITAGELEGSWVLQPFIVDCPNEFFGHHDDIRGLQEERLDIRFAPLADPDRSFCDGRLQCDNSYFLEVGLLRIITRFQDGFQGGETPVVTISMAAKRCLEHTGKVDERSVTVTSFATIWSSYHSSSLSLRRR